MAKKIVLPRPKSLEKAPRQSKPPKSMDMLGQIQRKIESSAALNGGFDTLLFKMDKLESGQEQIVDKVDKIHEAIYDPSDGLFSKLSDHRIDSTQRFGDIDMQIAELGVWKTHKEKSESRNEDEVSEATDKIATLEKSVDTLTKSKNTTTAAAKWITAGVGGGILTLFFNWLGVKLHLF